MIEETARVLYRDGPWAWVATGGGPACGACASGHGCGAGALTRLFPRRPAELRVADPIGVLPGEQVVIGVDEAALVASALSAYLVPLLALLAGAIAASTVPGAGETGAMVGAASGFAAGLWFARSAGRRLAQHDRFQPTVLRRMAEQEKGPRIPLAV